MACIHIYTKINSIIIHYYSYLVIQSKVKLTHTETQTPSRDTNTLACATAHTHTHRNSKEALMDNMLKQNNVFPAGIGLD